MDTKKLRQKILDLAIHGKLVPQDPNDEPASVLLERIRTEKERLVKEGKIKKSKALKTSDTPHYENVPFEIPSSWEWVKFEFVCKKLTDGSHNPPPKKSTGYTVISAQNIKNGKIVFTEKDRYTDDIGFNKENPRTRISKGDIILGIIGGSIGNVGIFNHDKPVIAQRSVSIIDSYVSNLYCFYLLQSPIFQSLFVEKSIGNAQAGVYLGELEKLMIPLPPLAEQIRIVAEIEKWCGLTNEIEQGKTNLQATIKQAKSKILDLAIHGKLVPQDPRDEPASELLKRINPKAEITCDNGQYGKLPNNWCLTKGSSIFRQMKSTKPYGKTFIYVDIDSIDNKTNTISSIKELQTINAPSRASRYTEKGDVVFSMVRPYLRNIAKITMPNCIASTGFYVCSPYGCMNKDFCYYMMLSSYVVDGLNQYMKGDNSPSITRGHIDNWVFPLPPLLEQQRIVAKIEELFSRLDSIQNQLEA